LSVSSPSPFAIKATAGGNGGSRVLVPQGTWTSRLAACATTGTLIKDFPGEPARTSQGLYLAFAVFCPTDPFFIAERVSISGHPKARLRAIVDALLGSPMADGQEANIADLVGRPIQVTIAHQKSQRGTYARVTNIAAMLSGVSVPPLPHPVVVWSFDMGTPPPTEPWLPWCYGEELSAVIRSSPEWAARGNGATAAPTDPSTGKEAY